MGCGIERIGVAYGSIIQEIVLASRIVIQCGSFQFSWQEIERLICSLDRARDYTEFKPLHSYHELLKNSPAWEIIFKRGIQSLPQDNIDSLLHAFHRFVNSKCADRRDKGFGIRNRSKNCCRIAVAPDYSQPVSDLCEKMLQHDLGYHSHWDQAGWAALENLCSNMQIKALLLRMKNHRKGILAKIFCLPRGTIIHVIDRSSWAPLVSFNSKDSLDGLLQVRTQAHLNPGTVQLLLDLENRLHSPRKSYADSMPLEHIGCHASRKMADTKAGLFLEVQFGDLVYEHRDLF